MKKLAYTTALVTMLVGSSPGRATVLNTPLIRSGSSSAVSYDCQLVNVSDLPMTDVSIALLKPDGAALSSVQADIQPGSTTTLSNSGNAASGVRCRVEGKFSRKKLVVTMQLLDAAGITQVVSPGQ